MHSLGINSHVNYLPLFAGIDPKKATSTFTKSARRVLTESDFQNKQNEMLLKLSDKNSTQSASHDRESWLFDLAEQVRLLN